MGATLLYLWTTSRSTPTRSWGEFWSFMNTPWNLVYHCIIMIMATSTWRTVLMIMWFQFWWTRQYERYLQTSHLLDLGWKVGKILVDFSLQTHGLNSRISKRSETLSSTSKRKARKRLIWIIVRLMMKKGGGHFVITRPCPMMWK